MTVIDVHGTEVVSDPDLPIVRITREFDAPTDRVFRAHVDPDLFSRWNGPDGTVMHVGHHDCRRGGSYRYTITREGFEAVFYGSFHEVRPDEAIVQTFTFEGVPDSVALERLVFEDIGVGRTRLTVTSLIGSIEERDAFVASGMESGVSQGYARLDQVLAEG